ncbi:hypothetical protein ACHMW5_02490 [Azospirillum melinis]|uniref:hypothetical protein n=1 Tax=Azospirillum melinis TaxID=328839 RepID=UPI003756DB4A
MKQVIRYLIPVNALFAIALGTVAQAATGMVVFNSSGCRGHFVVEAASGFAILEWFGGNAPQKGEVIVGGFEEFGMQPIYNTTLGQEGQVWVEDFWLSKASVIKKMERFCR